MCVVIDHVTLVPWPMSRCSLKNEGYGMGTSEYVEWLSARKEGFCAGRESEGGGTVGVRVYLRMIVDYTAVPDFGSLCERACIMGPSLT